MKKKSIIIFGGRGFIGKNLTLRLVKKNFLVTIVSRNKSTNFDFENKNLDYINCDIKKLKIIKKKIKKSYDFVINLSGNISHKKKKETFETHFNGCKNLIEFFKTKNISLFYRSEVVWSMEIYLHHKMKILNVNLFLIMEKLSLNQQII